MSSVANNAGIKGNGALSRGVKRSVNNAMDEALMERQGTNRYMATNKKFAIILSDTILTIDYKIKGKKAPIQESYEYLNEEATLEQLKESSFKGDDVRLAIEQPQFYWLLKYHRPNVCVDETLLELGCKEKRRRRRRRRTSPE